MKEFLVVLTVLVFVQLCDSLIVKHNFQDGLDSFSFQTFTGVAMYSAKDAPEKGKPGNGHAFIKFDLALTRTEVTSAATLELVIMPDTNINEIGTHFNGEFRLCCDDELVSAGKCKSDMKNKLIISKQVKGLQRHPIVYEAGRDTYHLDQKYPVKVTGIHVFGLANCNDDLGAITFEGTSVWMNPFGQLPGDVYGYLPFYGYMCIAYLVIAVIWFCFNAFYWKQLLHVQNCVTGVLALCLVEMATWYFDYLHLNTAGVRHHGPFILGLVTTVSRRMVARMLTVAVSMGYGVVKPTLGSVRNKIIILGCVYWIFAFMFEALIHYNQTEKVETWMRVVLIPPVAIINGIFWWWTFVSLNKTIEYLKVRRQSAKLRLYKYFTMVLVVALIAAIGFAVYEMYYVLQQLYFAEWERLWFMEVGFWQILFSVIFGAIMILWRPSEHFKRYGESLQLGGEDDEDLFNMPIPDNMDDMSGDSGDDRDDDDMESDEDDMDDENAPQAKFTIDDMDDEEDGHHHTTRGGGGGSAVGGHHTKHGGNKKSHQTPSKIQKVAEQFLGDNDEDNQLAAQKMQ